MSESKKSENRSFSDIPTLDSHSLDHYSELESDVTLIEYLELILKKPGKIFYEINHNPKVIHFVILAGFTSLFLLVYGLIVGSFTGGEQYFIAPAKIISGLFFSALICLPSLYIFSCLGQVKVGFINIMGNLLITLTLMSILLIGFAPVIWIFSQSTTSIPFIGFIHLVIYAITVAFSFKVLSRALDTVSEQNGSFITVWMVIFVVVSLQMSTSLRPIIGKSETILPEGKKFFLTHWMETMDGKKSSKK